MVHHHRGVDIVPQCPAGLLANRNSVRFGLAPGTEGGDRDFAVFEIDVSNTEARQFADTDAGVQQDKDNGQIALPWERFMVIILSPRLALTYWAACSRRLISSSVNG